MVPSGVEVATDLAVLQSIGQGFPEFSDSESRTRMLRWTSDQLTP
jgi:hypothetical protein